MPIGICQESCPFTWHAGPTRTHRSCGASTVCDGVRMIPSSGRRVVIFQTEMGKIAWKSTHDKIAGGPCLGDGAEDDAENVLRKKWLKMAYTGL